MVGEKQLNFLFHGLQYILYVSVRRVSFRHDGYFMSLPWGTGCRTPYRTVWSMSYLRASEGWPAPRYYRYVLYRTYTGFGNLPLAKWSKRSYHSIRRR